MSYQETGRDRIYLRCGSVVGIVGVFTALVQTAIDPSRPDDPAQAIRAVAASDKLAFSRMLDLIAFMLLLVAVGAITKVLADGSARAWARMSLVLYAVSASAGGIATMIVGSLPDVGDSWAKAPADLKPGYVGAYDALDTVSGGIFAVSWIALGGFGLFLAAAIVRNAAFARRIAWISAISGVASIAAVVLGVGLHADAAFVLLLAGVLLSYVVIISTGLKAWRLAGTPRAGTQKDQRHS